jgi:P27 family predicted phage terminase small subunit
MRKKIQQTTIHAEPKNAIPVDGAPPDWLSEHAKTVWNQTLLNLANEGRFLSLLNYETLVAFCDAAGLVKQCAQQLEKDGMTIDGGREGLKRHPAVTTRISALNSLRAYAAELGLTPSASPRLPAKHIAPKDSPFAKFMPDVEVSEFAEFL